MMPGWDGFSIPGWFSQHYDAPVLVDNDVNIMALGEHWTHWRDCEHLLFVKIGTGIGCGIVSDRRIHRGAQGAAGDIGHVRLGGHTDVVCRCGNVGCLEAVAGGRALAAQLTAAGLDATTSRDVVRLVRAGEPPAIAAVRDAGRYLGEVLAECINFFNPGAIVIGGDISEAHQQLLAGVREVAFGRSLPMATRDLRMGCCQLGDRAGVIGAAIMVVEHVLAPETVDRAIHGYMTHCGAKAPTDRLSTPLFLRHPGKGWPVCRVAGRTFGQHAHQTRRQLCFTSVDGGLYDEPKPHDRRGIAPPPDPQRRGRDAR